jgi:type I restriction enzyme, S subunit
VTSQWPRVPLRAVTTEAQSGPFGSQLHSDEYVERGIPVINPSNIVEGRLFPDWTVTVDEETAGRLSRHRLEPGDLVFARRGELGRAAVVTEEAEGWLCGTGSLRVRLRAGALDPRFAGYLLQSAATRSYFEMTAVGTTMDNLNTAIVVGLPIPLPAMEDQMRVSDLLDYETARIDALITKKRDLSRLLAERRSGLVETEIRRLAGTYGEMHLKAAADITVGIVVTPAAWYADNGIPALRGLNIKPGRVDASDLVYLSAEGHRRHWKSALREGDVVAVRTGQAGVAAVVPAEFDGANCVDLLIIRPGQLDPEYLTYVLNSDWTQKHIERYSVGTIQAHFNVGTMANLPLPVPPIEVQQSTVRWLAECTGIVDKTSYALDHQLALLRERRAALITAAVTGQLDIPHKLAG